MGGHNEGIFQFSKESRGDLPPRLARCVRFQNIPENANKLMKFAHIKNYIQNQRSIYTLDLPQMYNQADRTSITIKL